MLEKGGPSPHIQYLLSLLGLNLATAVHFSFLCPLFKRKRMCQELLRNTWRGFPAQSLATTSKQKVEEISCRVGLLGVLQATRPLRDSSVHSEVGSPEKDEWEKRTPVGELTAGRLLCSCRGEGSRNSTPGLRTARRQSWSLAQKSGSLKTF